MMVWHETVTSEFSEASLGELEKIPHLRKLIHRMRKPHKKKKEHRTENNQPLSSDKVETNITSAFTEIPETVVRHSKREKNKAKNKLSVADAKLALERKGRGNKRPKESSLFPSTTETTVGSDVLKATKHEQFIKRSAKCGTPSARLVRVREVHPLEGHITYIPHCTWLHRCQDETACCPSEAQTCVPATKEDVQLYFHRIPMGGRGTIVQLSFENHTLCECRDRNSESMPRTEPHLIGPKHRTESQVIEHKLRAEVHVPGPKVPTKPHMIGPKARTESHVPGPKYQMGPSGSEFSHPAPTAWATSLSLAQMKNKHGNTALGSTAAVEPRVESLMNTNGTTTQIKCQCVGDYDLMRIETNTCVCDCHEHRKNCLKLKRGKEVFFLRDRRCIEQGRCAKPLCQYGTYIVILGRCPRRQEGDSPWLKILQEN